MMKISKRSIFNKNSALYKKNNVIIKSMLVTTFISILIGMMFGMIVLNMVKNESHDIETFHEADNGSNTLPLVNHKNGEDMKNKTLSPMTLYTIQAGVFTKKENSEQWKNHFSNQPLTVTWLKDGQYYLLIDFSLSESEIISRAKVLKEDGYDVFAKTWEIPSVDIALNDISYDWFDTFHTVWQHSFAAIDDDSSFDKRQWEQLVENNEQHDPRIHTLQNIIGSHMIERESDDDIKKAHIEIIKTYEAVILR